MPGSRTVWRRCRATTAFDAERAGRLRSRALQVERVRDVHDPAGVAGPVHHQGGKILTDVEDIGAAALAGDRRCEVVAARDQPVVERGPDRDRVAGFEAPGRTLI